MPNQLSTSRRGCLQARATCHSPCPLPCNCSPFSPTARQRRDRKSTRLNPSHLVISYAVFCLKKKKRTSIHYRTNRSNLNLASSVSQNPYNCQICHHPRIINDRPTSILNNLVNITLHPLVHYA